MPWIQDEGLTKKIGRIKHQTKKKKINQMSKNNFFFFKESNYKENFAVKGGKTSINQRTISHKIKKI